jgi:hypothetical protein
VLRAVLDSEGPEVGTVSQPFPPGNGLVQARVTLLFDHIRAVGGVERAELGRGLLGSKNLDRPRASLEATQLRQRGAYR